MSWLFKPKHCKTLNVPIWMTHTKYFIDMISVGRFFVEGRKGAQHKGDIFPYQGYHSSNLGTYNAHYIFRTYRKNMC